jgi:hypothetical protein
MHTRDLVLPALLLVLLDKRRKPLLRALLGPLRFPLALPALLPGGRLALLPGELGFGLGLGLLGLLGEGPGLLCERVVREGEPSFLLAEARDDPGLLVERGGLLTQPRLQVQQLEWHW